MPNFVCKSIGKGSFGQVFRVKDQSNNEYVIKEMLPIFLTKNCVNEKIFNLFKR